MLENSEGAIKNVQSRETGSIGYTRHKAKKNITKTQHNQYVLDSNIHKQTQITYIRHEPSYKQLDENTN